MSYEVKVGYISGNSLVFTAFQPNGVGRGIANQPLTETPGTGYYSGSPLTDLVAGDEVISYILDYVYWEGALVYILTYDSVYWEHDRVFYEGDWVYDLDDIISETITSRGDIVGANEFSLNATDLSSIFSNIETLITGQQTINSVIDNTGLDANGNPIQFNGRSPGYVETQMIEV